MTKSARALDRLIRDGRRVVLVVGVISMLVPLYWLVSTSFKPGSEMFSMPPQWVPSPITLEHYAESLGPSGSFSSYFQNSVITSVTATLLALVIGIPTAYGFAQYKYRFSNALLILVLVVRMLPPVSLVLPYFNLMGYLNLLDTRIGVIIVHLAIELPLIIWLLEGFFRELPRETLEAAELDGLNVVGVMARVGLPLSLPAIGVAAMFGFVQGWNELLYALTLTRTPAAVTMPVGIAGNVTNYGAFWGQMSASAVVYVIPVILVAMFAQRGLVRGLMSGSSK